MTGPSRRVLLVANRTCPCPTVLETVRERAAGGHVHIVAPALNSRLRHWLSDIDEAVADARRRLTLAVDFLTSAGLTVTGSVGDSEPLTAIADMLSQFSADELVIATLPPGRSHWLERDLPARAAERFSIPVVHVVGEDMRNSSQPYHGSRADDIMLKQRMA